MIQRGVFFLNQAATGDALSEYHLEAGIAACHTTAAADDSTDWPRILSFYDQLVALTHSPVAALNRAVAIARVRGPQAGLDALADIAVRSPLESYHLFHAVRGTLAAELGRFVPGFGSLSGDQRLDGFGSEIPRREDDHCGNPL